MIILQDLQGNEIASGDTLAVANGELRCGGVVIGGFDPTMFQVDIDGVTYTLSDAFQYLKPLALKQAENAFFQLCQAVTGKLEKLGFAELNAALDAMMQTDPDAARLLSIKLLAVDAQCKREGGLSWWDSCAWHAELAAP